MLARSSAFFSKELTHSFLFCLQREAAARFLSRKRCLLSSGSISVARRRLPPVGWAGDTLGIKKGIIVRNFYPCVEFACVEFLHKYKYIGSILEWW